MEIAYTNRNKNYSKTCFKNRKTDTLLEYGLDYLLYPLGTTLFQPYGRKGNIKEFEITAVQLDETGVYYEIIHDSENEFKRLIINEAAIGKKYFLKPPKTNKTQPESVFAVDFDGTLCECKYPDIGEPKKDVIEKCKQLKASGHKLILWTCRYGELLDKAVEWCKQQGLEFDAINKSTEDYNLKYGETSGKAGANYYIDDKNLSIEEFLEKEF